MKKQKYLKFEDKSLKITIEDWQERNITSEQIRKMTAEEIGDYFAAWMVDNLNENVMREDAEDKERARKLEEATNDKGGAI